MLRASILLFVFTCIFQALLNHFIDWFSYLSVLLSMISALVFILFTNFIWHIEWKAIAEVFKREVEDDNNVF